MKTLSLDTNPPDFQLFGYPLITFDISPDSFEVVHGAQFAGKFESILESDNADVSIGRAGASVQSRTALEINSTSTVELPLSMQVTLEGSVFSRSAAEQRISLFNFQTGDWEEIDSGYASRFTDRVDVSDVEGDLSRFVEPGTLAVLSRLDFWGSSPRLRFSSNIDLFRLTLGR